MQGREVPIKDVRCLLCVHNKVYMYLLTSHGRYTPADRSQNLAVVRRPPCQIRSPARPQLSGPCSRHPPSTSKSSLKLSG